jgi:hypothetical protein
MKEAGGMRDSAADNAPNALGAAPSNDDEYEVGDLDSLGSAAPPVAAPWERAPRPLRAQLPRLLLTVAIVALALGIITAQIVPLLRAKLQAGTSPPTATLNPSIGLIGTSPLAAAPTNCPAGQAPQNIAPEMFGPAVGRAPVWVGTFEGPPTTLRVRSYQVRLQMTPYGWPKQLFVVLLPPLAGDVRLSATNLSNGSALWLTDGLHIQPTTSAVISAQGFGAGAQQPRWIVWGITLYIPTAGCYMLDARWRGGEWQVPFAAGN